MLGLTLLMADGPAPGWALGPVILSSELGAGISERSGPAPLANAAPEWLPAGRAVCASLGLSDTACSLVGILNASAQQTDPALWFGKVLSMVGAPLDSCEKARAIQSYRTIAGTSGTTYLCQTPVADDHIADAALAALQSRAAQLNSATPVTFADHQAAKNIKSIIDFYTRPAGGSR